MTKDEKFMKIALKEAEKAYEKQEVPIGAVIVLDGKVLSKAHNMRNEKKSATAHAEVLAIEKACKKIGDWRLNDCEMYVTLEPCPMCAGAILNARIKKVYFGAYEQKCGSLLSNHELLFKNGLNHTVEVEGGLLLDDCSRLIKTFFEDKRAK